MMTDSKVYEEAASAGRTWARTACGNSSRRHRSFYRSEDDLVRSMNAAALHAWRHLVERKAVELWWKDTFIEWFEGAAIKYLEKN